MRIRKTDRCGGRGILRATQCARCGCGAHRLADSHGRSPQGRRRAVSLGAAPRWASPQSRHAVDQPRGNARRAPGCSPRSAARHRARRAKCSPRRRAAASSLVDDYRRAGRARRPARHASGNDRLLHSGRTIFTFFDFADDGDPGAGGRREAHRRRVSRSRPRAARGRRNSGRDGDRPDRRRAGHRRVCVRHAIDSARGQNLRSGKSLRDRGEAPGFKRLRDRHARRPDRSANSRDGREPRFIAADLLAQAEHDPDAVALLVTTSARLARDVAEEVAKQLADLPRTNPAWKSLESASAILVASSTDAAVRFANRVAPEHLSIPNAEPRLVERLTEAGQRVSRAVERAADRRLCQRHKPRAADVRLGARARRIERVGLREVFEHAGNFSRWTQESGAGCLRHGAGRRP